MIERRKLILNILGDSLDTTKWQAGEVVPNISSFPLLPFLEEIKRYVTAVGGTAHGLAAIAAGRYVAADPKMLHQALTNICSNAVKYGEGRPISLTASFKPRSESESVGDLAVVIKDGGRGMTEEEMAKATVAFSQSRLAV